MDDNTMAKYIVVFLVLLVLCVFNIVMYLATTHRTGLPKGWDFRTALGQSRYSKAVSQAFPPVPIATNSNLTDVVKNSDQKPQKTKLIILGYKHGGTSITGAIIGSHPKVFYAYEPIWYMKDPDRHAVFVSDARFPLRERVKPEYESYINLQEPLDFIQSLLDCQLTNLTRQFMKYKTEDSTVLKFLHDCLYHGRGNCYENASQYCAEMEVTSLKTVRLSVEEAGQMMVLDPQIKLLFVSRDPRGNKNSRRNYRPPNKTAPVTSRKLLSYMSSFSTVPGNLKEPYHISRNFEMQCQIMNNDIEMLLMIYPTFKDRILLLRYEDLTDNPVDVSSKILQFLGLTHTPETLEKLAIMTLNQNGSGVRSNLVRGNPSETAMKWRTEIPFGLAKEVQRNCSLVFDTMGYNIFQTEVGMRDLSLSSHKQTYLEKVNKAL